MNELPVMTDQEFLQIKQYFSEMENQSVMERKDNLLSAMEIISKITNIDRMIQPDYLYVQLKKYAENSIHLLGFDESVFFEEDESESSLNIKIRKMLQKYDLNQIVHMFHVNDVINDVESTFYYSRLGGIYEFEIDVINKIDMAAKEIMHEELKFKCL